MKINFFLEKCSLCLWELLGITSHSQVFVNGEWSKLRFSVRKLQVLDVSWKILFNFDYRYIAVASVDMPKNSLDTRKKTCTWPNSRMTKFFCISHTCRYFFKEPLRQIIFSVLYCVRISSKSIELYLVLPKKDYCTTFSAISPILSYCDVDSWSVPILVFRIRKLCVFDAGPIFVK